MVIYDSHLSLAELERIVFQGEQLSLADAARKRIGECYSFLKSFAAEKVIYGINTGFGPMAQWRISDQHLFELQYNIIRSHATGAGEPLSDTDVRAAIVARIGTLVQGYSGVHISVVDLLVEFVNKGIYPMIPRHGSVGASGDLVQLAHLALALIGEGEVHYRGQWLPAEEVLRSEGLQPMSIHIREGLCITNGTSVMTGIGLNNIIAAKRLLAWGGAASAMVNEIAGSYDDFLSEEINAVKHHKGQQVIAAFMRKWLNGSQSMRNRQAELYNGAHKDETIFKHKVQPYYSLRCVPQVLGPVYDTLENAERVVIGEMNSACDNPIINPATKNVYHGGNFHGDYVSFEMDKLKIAVTKLTMLAERQLNYLFHDRINGILPPFVNMGELGLNYGLQASQFTATSTTAECQTLSMPNYIHSIPNNNDNQDIVSMGTNSALIARTVIENGYQVMAIHFMAIVQAVDCLDAADRLAPASRSIYDEIRAFFPAFRKDTPKYRDIARMIDYLNRKNIEL
ncbi:histidine ammonia-lyase [uncultured Alistipes sp.]|uniref:HAL/PAL/TAL family ammonia-lyase n=1 Tax=uncultured Alistipes sp. TaxID=538949 RepID=UPI0025D2EB3D|nr:aromatic amino acid ammonia-lyase [uncultured Alistipes sp.]